MPIPRIEEQIVLHHPVDKSRCRVLSREDISGAEPLLVRILEEGKQVVTLPSIEEMRKRREADMERLDTGIKRLVNPHRYHVSLTGKLWDLKQEMIESMKSKLPFMPYH
jgi:nicotinate phosphoribosyltransferase